MGRGEHYILRGDGPGGPDGRGAGTRSPGIGLGRRIGRDTTWSRNEWSTRARPTVASDRITRTPSTPAQALPDRLHRSLSARTRRKRLSPVTVQHRPSRTMNRIDAPGSAAKIVSVGT